MQIETKKINLRDGVSLNCEFTENGSPVWIIGTHGLGEHLKRHKFLLDTFSQDFNVFLYDLRGHGQTSGEKGLIQDISFCTEDLDEVITYLRKEYNMKRYILFGHSMGALIVSDYIQNKAKVEFYPERAFLSSPPVGVPGALAKILSFPSIKFLASLKSKIPGIKLKGLIDLKNLSHDPLVKDSYIADELNSLSLNVKTGLSVIHASRRVFTRPLRCECPIYVVCGTNDHIVDPVALETFFRSVEKSAILNMIQGGYHELHNEIDEYFTPYMEFLRESIMGALYQRGL